MSLSPLIMFYDSQCPLCCHEVTVLKRLDKNNAIEVIDLHDDIALQTFPNIDKQRALDIIHGYQQGKLLTGIDVTIAAWRAVGKNRWVAPLTWPILSTVSKCGDWFFAKYRHPISRLMAKIFNLRAHDCSLGTCYGKKIYTDHRR
ncbi:thiol-disulfide oxidoreductase DCC family protein [Thalassotalea ganghwensis]